jgi:hypothetical protein
VKGSLSRARRAVAGILMGVALIAAAVALTAALSSCSELPSESDGFPMPSTLAKMMGGAPGGELAVKSQAESGASLEGGFGYGLYRLGNQNSVTVLLFDGPPETATQAMSIRMFWRPRAGRTPIDPTATNATIHYVIFTGKQGERVGIYSGAGFVYPDGALGGDTLRGGVWQATLSLSDHSEGFDDLLGEAILKGRFRAKRDDVALDLALRKLNVRVREALGYPRLVNSK